MTNPYVDYDQEAEVRLEIAKLLERDTVEAMDQYTRLFASMVGERVWEDKPPSERLGIFISHPPLIPMSLAGPEALAGYEPEAQAMFMKLGGVPPPDAVPVVDPATGQPVMDPNSGTPAMDPMTGQPVVDPMTGQPVIDGQTQLMQPVFPAWTALAAEFPAYYIEQCHDFDHLITQWQKGKLKPKFPEQEAA